MSLFEKASRLKLRFPTGAGVFSPEDLWDLPLTAKNKPNLNDLGLALKRKLKDVTEESLVDPKPKKDDVMQLSFDLVKHVIDTKCAERDKAKHVAELKAKRQKIIDAIVNKEDQNLQNASMEDLKKQLDELGSLSEETA
jgi:hypothetical protein